MTSSTTKGKIEEIKMTDLIATGHKLGYEGEIFTILITDTIVSKVNEVIKRLNELERTKHG